MVKYLLFISLIATLFFVGCNNISSITKSEFSIDKANNCIQVSSSLNSRCSLAGGTIQNPVTSLGITAIHTLGCYPEEKASDSGEKCVSSKECDGECIWLEGDVVDANESSACSDYKKPLFIYEEGDIGEFICK